MPKSKAKAIQVVNCSNVLKGRINTGTVELQYPASSMRKTRERDYHGLFLRGDDALTYLVHIISVLNKFGDQMDLMNKLHLLGLSDLLADSIEGENSQTVKDAVAALYEKFGPKEAQSEEIGLESTEESEIESETSSIVG